MSPKGIEIMEIVSKCIERVESHKELPDRYLQGNLESLKGTIIAWCRSIRLDGELMRVYMLAIADGAAAIDDSGRIVMLEEYSTTINGRNYHIVKDV